MALSNIADSKTVSSPLLSRDEDIRSPPFTWCPLIAILGLGFIKPVCCNVIFPFISQMILESGIVDSAEQVGVYSGLIESLFSVMGLLTIFPWTHASDRFGRKPVVVYGAIGVAISTTIFGISKTFGMMVMMRCLGGAFAGTRSTTRVMLAELYPHKQHRISAFSALQIAIRVGQVTGQFLGGLLSHPERNMKLFDYSFWREYPFALPGFVAGTLGVMAWAYGVYALKETLPRKKRDPEGSTTSETSTLCNAHHSSTIPVRVTYRSCLTTHVISVLTSTFLMTLMSETFFALYPLYAFTPPELGGLGLSEAEIGVDMALRALLIILLIILSSPMQRRFGALKTYQIGMFMWPTSIVFLPVLNWMVRTDGYGSKTLAYRFAFCLFNTIWAIGALVWPSSQIMVVDSTPADEALATVSGLAQVVQALGQALSPAFVTSLFAFSIQSRILKGNLVYAILFALSVLGTLQSLRLNEAGYSHTHKTRKVPSRGNETVDEGIV